MPAPAYSKVGTDEEAADEEAAVAARFSTDRRASRVSSVDSLAADDDDQDAQDQKSKAQLLCLIIVIVAFFVLGIIDSFTTKFVKRGSIAFAMWTIEYAPWSFIVYCSIIGILIIGCLPYGPLSLLMGAVCTSLYGFAWGVTIGFLMLFTTTMVAGGVCFVLARYKFKTFVQRKINKSKKLRVLRNLDQIIKDGQGFEMVVLIRLAPLPTGPTQYFLGTTSVLWRDFLAANGVTNALFSISDIMMGAGAALLSKDNPVGLALFVIAVVAFFVLMGYVGYRAKKKLNEIDQRERSRLISLEQEELEIGQKREGQEKVPYKVINLKSMDDEMAVSTVWERLREVAAQEGRLYTIKLFKQMDEDSSGFIDAKELRQALKVVNLRGCSFSHAKAVIKSADQNLDGLLNYQEFAYALKDEEKK